MHKSIMAHSEDYFVGEDLDALFVVIDACRRQGMLTQGPAPDPKSKV